MVVHSLRHLYAEATRPYKCWAEICVLYYKHHTRDAAERRLKHRDAFILVLDNVAAMQLHCLCTSNQELRGASGPRKYADRHHFSAYCE